MRELPHLLAVASEFQAQGGRLLGVSHDLIETEDEKVAKEKVNGVFKRPKLAPFTTVLLKEDDGVNEMFGLGDGGIPQTVAIDRNGEVVDRQAGGADHARLAAMMRKALGG